MNNNVNTLRKFHLGAESVKHGDLLAQSCLAHVFHRRLEGFFVDFDSVDVLCSRS